MSYLDELKNQAEKQKLLAEANKKRAAQLEKVYRERLLPKMENVYTYLTEVVEHLNKLQPDTRVDFQLDELGKLENLLQANYSLHADSRNDMKEVLLAFDCSQEGELEVIIESKLKVEKWSQYLQQHHLKFHTRKHLDENQSISGAKFFIQKSVPVSFKFVVDVENSNINLFICNFDKLGVRQVQFSPESLGNDTLDKLAQYVARESDSFFNLEISESERQRLRAKVMYEQQQREQELRESEARAKQEEEKNKKKSIFGIFKGK